MSEAVAIARLKSLQEHWKKACARFERNPDDIGKIKDAVKFVLTETCDTVRRASAAEDVPAERLSDLVNQACELEEDVVNMVYTGKEEIYDFIPTFCGNVVQDTGVDKLNSLGMNAREELARILAKFAGTAEPGPSVIAELGLDGSNNYDRSLAPSAAHSTKLARFRAPVTPLATSASEILRAVYEARLEASSHHSAVPAGVAVVGSRLVSFERGYFGKESFVTVFDSTALSQTKDFDRARFLSNFSPGLAYAATETTVDSTRGLIFTADSHRIKSYSLTTLIPDNPKYPDGQKNCLPVHTMKSSNKGPLAVIGSHMVRVGSQSLEYWDIDRLPTHGPKGVKTVGKKLNPRTIHTSREDDEFEHSSGIEAHKTVKLAASAQGNFECWAARPSQPAEMICAWDRVVASGTAYSCVSLNVETGLRASRWLGHGGKIHAIRSSPDDPHNFVTSTGDGTSRLYDARIPVPTLAVYSADEHIFDTLFVHVDGHPFIINAGQRTQSVRVWDVRAQKCLYELATGNNDPLALAWDAPNHTLFVASECSFMDRAGYHHFYREYKKPAWERQQGDDADGSGDEDDDGDDRCWPSKAFHNESSFGYAFDCSEHRILRYAFKPEADIEVVPPYGDATMHGDDDFW